MANTVKKKNFRLKKRVRKTFGALFLASAIGVASIPVDNLKAQDPGSVRPLKVTVDIENCRIPIVEEDETIYTTGDGKFQFAYVSTNDAAASNKVAVILGYDGGRLEGGILTIPDTVDAYLKYSENLGTTYGYCAVGKSGNFLFYEVITEKTDEWGNVITEDDLDKPVLDEEGNPTTDPITGEIVYEQKPVLTKQYKPCYYNDYSKWSDLEVDEFYYPIVSNPGTGEETVTYNKTEDSTVQRIQAASVVYIGNQCLLAGTGSDAGTWTIKPKDEGGHVDTPEEGIFRGEKAGNIETLHVGKNLSGIGNYAFYGCTNLSSIKLENGLDTIGNFAFASCVNLEKVDVEITAMITTIGDHAFYNCRALKSFTNPRQVASIGDSAFEGCTRLEEVELCGLGKNVQLSKLGHDVFKNCSSLKAVVLPDSYEESNLDISMWEGCTSLQHITANNGKVNFVEDPAGEFGFAEFIQTVPSTFYFEGMKNSPLYESATSRSMAFRYLNEDVYEITIESNGKKAVYQVNSSNELIYCDISSGIAEVEIPATIGPYNITSIWSTSFQGSCSLEKIVIPSSIRTIEKEAFRGCHNLKTVIFSEPVNITSIGTNAFQTQDVFEHKSNCPHTALEKTPTLQFVGPISYSCVPFNYAMDPNSNINVGTQVRSYITYYSSWPQNLQVKYNPDTDKNELINYPTFRELQDVVNITTQQAALEKYPYMTSTNWEELIEAAQEAVRKNSDPALVKTMTDYEKEIINATLNIVLPEGIEAIQKGLFTTKELDPSEPSVDKTITAYSLVEVAPESFKDCKNLVSIDLADATTSIGDHAFENCNKLVDVYLPKTVQKIGLRPFANCSSLSDIAFSGNPKYACSNSIIFELDSEGNKYKIIEYLQGRESGVVTSDELTGVKEIAEEAFMETQVSSVDLRETLIEDISAYSFAETPNLFAVYIPESWKTITDGSFANSKLQYIEIPGNLGFIGNDAFTNRVPALTFNCEEGSSAKNYADKNGIKTTSMPIIIYYTVRFWDYDNTLLDTQEVLAGEDAIPPEVPGREGYIHTGWAPEHTAIDRDIDITAQYEAEHPDAHKLKVTFLDHDDTEIKTILVKPGEDAEPPIDPVREGYRFIGWRPALTNITEDTVIYAQYEKMDSTEWYHTVRFLDYDDKELKVTLVEPGKDAELPLDPTRDGYRFVGWRPAVTNVQEDITTYAQYEKMDSTEFLHTVTFLDYDDKELKVTQVGPGEDAEAPVDPVRAGYRFTGWRPAITNVQEDIVTYAQYEKIDSTETQMTVRFIDYDDTVLYTQKVIYGADAIVPKDPSREGYRFTGWRPAITGVTKDLDTYAQYEKIVPGDDGSNGGNGGNNGTGGDNIQNVTKMFTLTVRSGSGSGSYAAGTQPIIIANDPAEGQEFSHWTISPESAKIASLVLTATVVTMPEGDVTVTAHYKTKTNTDNNNNNSNNNNNNKPNNSGTISNGTTVVIDKNGLSNTGVVSATVNGSSDNFTIKISNSTEAAEAAVRALKAEFGNLDGIKYFPMDISLYDSKGKNKITDTTGLEITVTIPLPDSMIKYAGNNKVAGIVESRLDKMNAKFTTISGVACITFKAEHFSPYVIYVDTNNLTASGVRDETPKTGDGIHPKWFLSIGLACVSIVLFMKKDKRKLQKVKA
ncbi:MAG: hypothetical protein E7287_07970 [Lachnospiraceae bacterium]|nr:hypothetical protein [Lachnospiraceae bacterium]